MEKFNKHADIPYNSKVYINACENTTDLCLVVPELGAIEFPFDYTPGKVDDTVKFIVEACNNYYRLKEQNEKLKEALKSITLSVSVHYDCTQGSEFQDMVNICNKALKSCEP